MCARRTSRQAAAATGRRLAGLLTSAGLVAGLTACGAGSPAVGPLAADVAQKSASICVPAPNPSYGTTWNTPVWFAMDMFINLSRSPITVESVSLRPGFGLRLSGSSRAGQL